MKACVAVAGGAMLLALASLAQQPMSQEIPLPRNLSTTLLLPIDTIVFDFQRAELEPRRWGFEIHADGHGRYYAQAAEAIAAPSWQEVTASKPTMERLLAGAQHGESCETRAKHIASTGQKTLSYVHGDAWFTCTFNYSDNDAVMKASDAFQAMAATIQFGVRLQREQRFDRLGLDAEMTSLEDEVKAGRALELANIAPVLRSLAEDARVIDRVRRRAARMLESVAAEQDSAKEAPAR
jgi:hypothetical protein